MPNKIVQAGIPGRARQSGVHAAVDWGDPITKGLLVYYVQPAGGIRISNYGTFNLVNRAIFDAHGGAHTVNALGPLGPAADFAGSVNRWFGYAAYANSIGAGDYTVACHMRTHTSISGYMPIWAFGAFAPSVYQNLNGSGTWGAYHGVEEPANTTVSASTWYSMVAARRSGVIYFYLNGLPDGSSANTSSWGASGTFRIGHNGSSSGLNGAVTYLGFWDRGLQQSEAARLHRDPWCMLDKLGMGWQIPVYHTAAVGGATNPKGPLGMPLHGALGGPI